MTAAGRLVEYVLLAEFDIDKGSTLRSAYPSRVVGYDDSVFAEIMLPEGVHNRSVKTLFNFPELFLPFRLTFDSPVRKIGPFFS